LTPTLPRVLVSFVSAAASTPTSCPCPAADKPTRSGRLLGLLHKLIDYGKELAATIRRRAVTDPTFVQCSFGTTDLTLILARITRGLHRAAALEARIARNAAGLDAAPRPARISSPRKAPAPPQAPARTDDIDPSLTRLPTPAQIAAEVRRRPIGTVIADICRDLGILPSHPLWRELQYVLIAHNGGYARLVIDIINRAFQPPDTRLPPGNPASLRGPTLQFEAPGGTGPP
jgi:hypothetical protein